MRVVQARYDILRVCILHFLDPNARNLLPMHAKMLNAQYVCVCVQYPDNGLSYRGH